MTFLRSPVIVIDDQITSIFWFCSDGIRPSHAMSVILQVTPSLRHVALRRSISQPDQLPDASLEKNGGYDSASMPMRSVGWAANAVPDTSRATMEVPRISATTRDIIVVRFIFGWIFVVSWAI